MMETFSAWLERKGLEEQPILNTWEFKPPKKKKKKLKRTRCVVIKKEVDIEALLKHRPRGYKSTAWASETPLPPLCRTPKKRYKLKTRLKKLVRSL